MQLKKQMEEKRAWRAYRARVRALPQDYQVVFREMEKYLFKLSCARGVVYDTVLPGVLALFEENAAAGKGVLRVTGRDVAGFCDALL